MNKAAARGVVVAAACVAAAVSATTSTVMFHECVVNPTACDAADTATAFLQVFGTRKSSPSVGDPTVTVFTRDLVADTKRYDEKARKTVTDKILKPGVVLKFVSGGDTYELEALRTKGGLLQSFKLNGWSILFNRPYEDQMDGTSFWPAPQSVWGWPPPRELDPTPSNDYNTEYDLSVDEDGKSFKMTSPVSKRFNIRVSKKATVDAERLAFVLDYEIENMGSEPQRWAPWEISRVKPNGLTFFLTGTHTSSGSWPKLPTTQEGGVTWFSQEVSDTGKLFADTKFAAPGSSKAWLAHTDGKLLFVKCFDRIRTKDAAPGEDQVEIYDGGDYEEVEQQGAYRLIEPSKTLRWRVSWFLRRVPDSAKAQVGNKELADFAGSLCY
mmetsp:Transcript_75550/g.211778  ORF Transcript_75550/g.211778 Transcript_75550/m.211778 type:complete len:382 (+) Transcript_75550:122-1267(+)